MDNFADVRNVCADYLGGKWQEFCNDINVEAIELSFSNKVYRCSLTSAVPNDVIVKLFGTELASNNSMKINGITGEMVEFYLLSLCGIAPKLLAAFDTGRIEEFIKGRNVTNEDFFKDSSLLVTFAKILAKYHSQSMPICKQITYTDKILKKCAECTLQRPIDEFPEKDRCAVKSLFDFPMNDELEWALKNAAKINSKVVFAHNDIISANIILKDVLNKEDDRLVLIDYELSGYNYRGFDMAHFLLFLCYRIFKTDGEIVYTFDGDLNANIEKQFIEAYANELRKYDNFNEEFDNFDHLLMESRYFTLLAMIAAMGYGKKLLNSADCTSQMKSQAYIGHLTNGYRQKKELLLKTYSHILNK